MKNIVNSFKINTLSSRKGLGVGLTCLFLTLGVGQMWGAVGYESSDCGIKYSHNGGSDTEWNFSGQSAQTKTLTGNTTALYLKQWFAKMYQNEDNTIYGQDYHKCYYKVHRTAVSAGSTGFTVIGANWWDWTSWDGSGYRHPKGGHNDQDINLLNGLGSGKYTMTFYFQHNGKSTYKSTSNTLKWTYNIVPNVNSFAVTPNNVISGTGTNVDPYIITYGQDMTLTVSGSKASTDANSSLYAKFGDNAYSTTLTKTYNVTTSVQNVTVKAKYYNSADDLSGTEQSTTIYYKTVLTPSIGLTAPSSGVRGNSITLTAAPSNASTPTIYYEYSTSSTFASSVTEINHTTSTTQSWTIPSGTSGTTYYLRAKMQVSSTWYYSSILTLTAYGKKTIKVKNTNNWATMKLYLYNDSGEKEAWPGSTSGISSAGGQWKIVVLTSQWPYFILNNNNSGSQIKGDKTYKYTSMTDGNCYAISSGTGTTLTLSSVDCPTAPTSVTTTAAPTSITNTQMTVHGNIGGNGNDNITDYGFYYGTTSSCGTNAQVGTSNKTGAISKTITSLTPGQTYYFKTYATNGQGTTYGDVQSYKIPYKVTISKSTGCQSITPSAGSYYYNAGFTVTAVAATGYNFSTWTVSGGSTSSPSSPSTGTNTVTFTPTANNATITATYTPKTTSITLSQTGAATTGSVTTRTGTYNAAMPAITGSGSLPIAPNGYCFMGYYGSANGEGTKYYNADGSSAHTWDQVGATATLYAYFKKAEITVAVDQSIFSPVDAGGESWVTATPTVDPTPVAPTRICWALLYDDENPVPSGHDPVELADNKVKFNLAGLAAGNYKIRATLRTGSSSCAAGTLLSTYDKTITIATNFKVTVRYMCGDEAIKDTIMVDAHATSWTDISAPNITGYEFSTWDLGDGGLTTDKALTLQSGFRFKATYNGVLTAVYTKQKYIYLDLSQTFSESGKWNTPYCYLYNSTGDWNDGTGVGATSANCVKKGAMSQIAGTDIWYYDYSNASAFIDAGNNGKVAFTWGNKTTYGKFCDDVIYRGDFSEGTPLFIPAVGQSKVEENSNCAKYYNAGYWTNYVGAKTGYTLSIYNSAGDAVVKEQPFTSTSNDMRMTMKATVDLEAAKTYQVEIRRDNGHYYKNNSARDYSNSQVNWEYREDLTKGSLITTAAGDYVFTLSYTDYSNDKNFQVRMKVDYPATTNDFQVMYNDNATWSLGTTHGSGWRHPSRIITARAGGIDTISFFVAKGNSPRLYARKVNSINASTGVITWANINAEGSSTYKTLSVDSSAVYNFKVIQGAAGVISSIVNIGAYTGDYYIRCDAMNSKWDNYTSDGDHRMTYSSFSESTANAFGEKFSHYKAKWCKYGKNVKFVIANDYSPCISDTLTQDVPNTYNNIDAHGFLKSDGNSKDTENIYSANIRFMWNRKTNKISRAYVASSTNPKRLFLVLRGNYEIQGEDRAAIEDEGSGKPSVILQDDQNWIYEEVLYIKPGTRFKLYACYAQASANPNGAQYFRGAYESGAWAEDDTKSVILIDGSGDYQKARVLYDFKTNRLICAWLPSDTAVSGTLKINADVMIIREHQEAAQYLSFADADSKLTGVKTVYGVMKFNRCVLNNRQQTGTHLPLDVSDQKSIFERSLYFISFPFDVRLGDIFGFGQYGVHWILEYYDGLTRAKNGFWIDSPPNWKYVMPSEATSFVLKANEGYILALDLDQMKYNNTDFWPNDIQTVELFFPSTAELETLKQTTCTIPALSSDYKCTINRTGEDGDRRVKDSYWRCIGTPSLNLYNTAVKDGSGNTIAWKTDYTWHEDEREFPFIYMWNKADNTLTPQSTSTFRFLPMHSYLVQNGGKIVWTNISAKSSSIVSRRENDYQQIDYNWRLELAKDSQMVDQAYIRMSNLEQVTDTFDFGQDLSKEFNATRSNIYSFIGYEKAAANSMPLKTEQTTIVAIGLNIITAGEYTLGMPDGTDGVGVTLVDSETGTRTNLSAGMTYTLTLAAGDYTSRFYLEISPVKETPTGLEPTTDSSPKGREVRKVLIDGVLYIIRDGKIFDARGVMVK